MRSGLLYVGLLSHGGVVIAVTVVVLCAMIAAWLVVRQIGIHESDKRSTRFKQAVLASSEKLSRDKTRPDLMSAAGTFKTSPRDSHANRTRVTPSESE